MVPKGKARPLGPPRIPSGHERPTQALRLLTRPAAAIGLRMRKTLACLAFLLWTVAGAAAGIREGMSRAEVEAELGKPLSVMTQGDTAVLSYPNRGRVELVKDRVTDIVRVRRQDDPPTPEEAAAAAAAKAEEEARAALAAEAAEAAKAEKEAAAAEAAWAKQNADAQRKMEAAVESLSAEHGNPGAGIAAGDLMPQSSPAHFWLELAVSLAVQTGVGMVILKLAFKWADVHADWDQMLWPALAAACAGAAVRAAVYAAWNTTECFHVDDAISYFALLITLLKATHACTWQRAVGVAAAAKLMSIVVWVFLSVAISRMLFA